jgi:hypothetical protein
MPTSQPSLLPYRNANDGIITGDYNTQVLDKARWEQESLAGIGANLIGPLALLYAPTAFPNLLVNGGFEMSNLAPSSPITGGVAYTVDGWVGTAGACRYEVTAVHGGLRSLALPTNGGEIAQYLENPTQYRNEWLFLSAWVYGSTNASAFIEDGIGATTTPISTPPSTWTLVQVRRLIASAATRVKVCFHNADGVNELTVDDVTLNSGYAPSAFAVGHPAFELRRAMRFFQTVRCTARFRALANLTERDIAIPLPVPMGGTPTFIQINSGTTGNLNRALTTPTGTPVGIQADRVVYKFVPAAAGDCYCVDDQLALSWYPPNDQGL